MLSTAQHSYDVVVRIAPATLCAGRRAAELRWAAMDATRQSVLGISFYV